MYLCSDQRLESVELIGRNNKLKFLVVLADAYRVVIGDHNEALVVFRNIVVGVFFAVECLVLAPAEKSGFLFDLFDFLDVRLAY